MPVSFIKKYKFIANFDVQSFALTVLSGIWQRLHVSRVPFKIEITVSRLGTCEIESDILIFMSSNRNCTRDSSSSKDHPLMENHRLLRADFSSRHGVSNGRT